ncbi:MAG: SDR family NAD(P)-dependent oxidoreductase [Bacteroidota bacterium]|nr:SDR family NAD(P)-dependent oxidoreductase [Bacteroidota bacterium]
MSKLSGKIAIVSGGSGSLGRVVVEHLLSEGVVVITTMSDNKSSLDFLREKQKQHQSIEGFVVDVTSESSAKKFYTEVLSKHPSVDILCNLVGGVCPKKFIEDLSLAEWNSMINLNLNSCFLMIRESISSMKKNRFGRIINIAAMPGIIPEAKRGGYGVSKAGVIALTKTVAEEIKDLENITINAIAPSIILTEENKKWGTIEEIKKWVTPEQIANMILYLCSENGRAMNGQIIQMYGRL